MFEDLGELDHILSSLDEWAIMPYGSDLTYLTGIHSPLVADLKKVMQGVRDREIETIKKNPGLQVGFSTHSKFLGELYGLLIDKNTPSKLSAYLDEIKRLLLLANNICLDVQNGRLEPLAATGKAVKDGGKKGHKATYGSDDDKAEMRSVWQLWVDEEIKNHPNHSFENIKSLVAKNHPNQVSVHQLKRYTKDSRKSSK